MEAQKCIKPEMELYLITKINYGKGNIQEFYSTHHHRLLGLGETFEKGFTEQGQEFWFEYV